ncbi:MAG: hypothetical protein IPK26_30265 [Planctomycetes bacterium]|nr:hypothetical protein [Planctomycetota bacterium]
MQRSVLLLLAAASASGLCAQSNTVPGLNGRLDVVDNLSYWGRRGAAHPNGEIGMAMLNTMCNPGTVNIPWQAAMQPNHPKFGFLIVRETGGRMVQISDYSFCKHAFTSTNFSGSCGTCQNPGTGSLMGIRCSDTYGAGNNGDPNWLGPATELDPWLGTWNPVGSYFDVGDPATGTGPADGTRSLNTGGFDLVKNRVTVQEPELMTAGRFFYGIHLMHQGEAVANRGDNLASRGFNPVYSGGSWTLNNNSIGQVHGSILQHWQGATLNMAGNGGDDGRFAVAVVTTPLGGGMYHYEYAVHNIDNNRGGAAFRIPVQAGATTTNYGFRDIDGNALNQWSAARVGNEIVFSAAANNALNWNSIYNFWFDCNVPPGNGTVYLDEARVGPGALTVAVSARAPNGIPAASIASVGNGCGGAPCPSPGAFYESFNGGFDLSNSGITMTLNNGIYTVGNTTSSYIAPSGSATTLGLGDDTETTVNLPFALPYGAGSTNSLVVCSNGFISVGGNGTSYTPNVAEVLSGAFCWYGAWKDLNPSAGGSVKVDSSPTAVRITWQGVYNYGTTNPNTFQFQFLPNGTVHLLWQTMVTGGAQISGWSRGGSPADPGNRDISATRAAGWSVCTGAGTPNLALAASGTPVLGTTVQFTTSNIPAGSPFGAVLVNFGQEDPARDLTTIGMAGCFAHVVSTGAASYLFFPAGASAQIAFPVTSNTAFLGAPLTAQSFTYSPPATVLGAISSNGQVMVLGM